MAVQEKPTERLSAAAIKMLCDIRLHHSFKFTFCPNNAKEGTILRVTYSDLGYNSSTTIDSSQASSDTRDNIDSCNTSPDSYDGEPAVILFIGGLMGGRFTLIRSHAIATRLRLRLLTMDRPSLGGSTAVPLKDRLAAHLAAVPALLAHLNIKHVVLAAHSGGAPYLMQTVLAHPHILHPSRPHIVLLAPWVHPKDSRTLAMQLTASLPMFAISKFHALARFMVSTGGFSSGLMEKAGGVVRSNKANGTEVYDKLYKALEDETWDGKTTDIEKFTNIAVALAMKYMFAEGVSGASEDALLFMRKLITKSDSTTTKSKQETSPGDDLENNDVDFVDYHGYAKHIGRQKIWLPDPLLQAQTDEEHSLTKSPDQQGKGLLHIDVYHAEEDAMVGERGGTFFESCWKSEQPADGPAAVENGQGAVPLAYTFSSKRCKGTNHDSIMDPTYNVAEEWLQKVADRWYGKA